MDIGQESSLARSEHEIRLYRMTGDCRTPDLIDAYYKELDARLARMATHAATLNTLAAQAGLTEDAPMQPATF